MSEIAPTCPTGRASGRHWASDGRGQLASAHQKLLLRNTSAVALGLRGSVFDGPPGRYPISANVRSRGARRFIRYQSGTGDRRGRRCWVGARNRPDREGKFRRCHTPLHRNTRQRRLWFQRYFGTKTDNSDMASERLLSAGRQLFHPVSNGKQPTAVASRHALPFEPNSSQ
jgi:hypothetical protein